MKLKNIIWGLNIFFCISFSEVSKASNNSERCENNEKESEIFFTEKDFISQLSNEVRVHWENLSKKQREEVIEKINFNFKSVVSHVDIAASELKEFFKKYGFLFTGTINLSCDIKLLEDNQS